MRRLNALLVGLPLTLVVACGSTSDPGTAPGPDRDAGSSDGGLRPSASAVWVDPANGSDDNTGFNEAAPLRTLRRALRLVRRNGTVHLAAGTYGAETGEEFAYALPSGVSIAADAPGSAVLAGSGGLGLRADGGATLTNVALTGFDTAIVAGGGEVTLGDVRVGQSGFMVVAEGSANVSATGVELDGATLAALAATGEARVSVQGSRFTNVTAGHAVSVTDAAEVVIEGSTIEKCTSESAIVSATGDAKLRLVSSTLSGNASALSTIEVGGTTGEKPVLELDGTAVTDNANGIQILADGKATVRTSTVARNGAVGIESHGTLVVRGSSVVDHSIANVLVRRAFDETPALDLGRRPSEPGENTFTVTSGGAFGLVVEYDRAGVVFFAEANTWSGAPPAEDGPQGGTAASLAAVYELSGSGYTVKF